MLITILDYVAMIGTVTCLNLTAKTYKAWLWYLIPTICFIIVVASKGLIGSTILGVALFFTGLKNYIMGRRKR